MSTLLLVASTLGELGAIGEVYGEVVLELRDRAALDFAVDSDAIAIEQLSDLTDGLFLTQPALNLLTLGESNVLAFSGNGVTMRLGVLVHSVLVCYREITLACFELLGTLFLCQEPVAFNFAIHKRALPRVILLDFGKCIGYRVGVP